MLSIAVMKSAVGLFKDLVGMVNERRKHYREAFERICTPLYEKLELVAKEYHGIFAYISAALSKKNPDLQSIQSEVTSRRNDLVIVRDGIVGKSFAILERVDRVSHPRSV
jgi:hypothetical protein